MSFPDFQFCDSSPLFPLSSPSFDDWGYSSLGGRLFANNAGIGSTT